MSDGLIFDKAKWHYEGEFPADLDQKQAFVMTGMYLGWILEHDLYSEDFADDWEEEIGKFKARKLTGPGVYQVIDGVFDDEMLSRKGLAFTKKYFDFETGRYLKDFEKLLAPDLPTTYHVLDTWENYVRLKPLIDKRFAVWWQKRRKE